MGSRNRGRQNAVEIASRTADASEEMSEMVNFHFEREKKLQPEQPRLMFVYFENAAEDYSAWIFAISITSLPLFFSFLVPVHAKIVRWRKTEL